jgi:hypothetical protein
VTTREVCEWLDKHHFYPDLNEGKVTHFIQDTWDSDGGVNSKEVSLWSVANQLGFASVEGFLDEHPEGADRGGYVPWLRFSGSDSVYSVYWYEPDGQWQDCR